MTWTSRTFPKTSTKRYALPPLLRLPPPPALLIEEVEEGETEVAEVAGNRVTSVVWGRPGGLRVANLNRNALDTLSPAVAALHHLTELKLAHNALRHLAPELGTLRHLVRLVLHHNRLTSLPASLGQLSALEELDVSHNQLETLPQELRDASQLRKLRAAHNALLLIHEDFVLLSRLTHLDVEANQLTRLPAGLGRCAKLTHLDCSYNQLRDLPLSLALCHFSAAEAELNVDDNPLPQEFLNKDTTTLFILLNDRLTAWKEEQENLGESTNPIPSTYFSENDLRYFDYLRQLIPTALDQLKESKHLLQAVRARAQEATHLGQAVNLAEQVYVLQVALRNLKPHFDMPLIPPRWIDRSEQPLEQLQLLLNHSLHIFLSYCSR